MRSSNLFLAVVGVLSVASSSQAYILIDTFEQGYHKATITGEGNQDFFADNLDKAKVYARQRLTNYIVNSNPFGYTTSFEVGLGEARVATPGPNDLSTELYVTYGTTRPMNLASEEKFEVDLQTDPP